VTKYDPAAAEALLDQAGWKRGPDGVRRKNGLPLSLQIVIPSGYGPSETLSALLQSDYSKIGVAATIRAYASGTYFGPYSAGGILQTRKFDAALLSQSAGPFTRTSTVRHLRFDPAQRLHIAAYCNKDVGRAQRHLPSLYDKSVEVKAAASFQRIIDGRRAGRYDVRARIFLRPTTNADGLSPQLLLVLGDDLMKMDI